MSRAQDSAHRYCLWFYMGLAHGLWFSATTWYTNGPCRNEIISSFEFDKTSPYLVTVSDDESIGLYDDTTATKASFVEENNELSNEKLKTQIDQANVVSAAQIANQLAVVGVNLAGIQLGISKPLKSPNGSVNMFWLTFLQSNDGE
ncbi:hypothetical protein DM860_006654 [Cuscuta australis]|uniref:Uncharacterized protein n=1 Tax=Cuscuta australis TaxID=267555 RepID=A0A328D594_9ASTE|nr:hypothetical protein DM860_006654 [Cuscuta australis]